MTFYQACLKHKFFLQLCTLIFFIAVLVTVISNPIQAEEPSTNEKVLVSEGKIFTDLQKTASQQPNTNIDKKPNRLAKFSKDSQNDDQSVLIEADQQSKDGDILTAEGYVNIYYQGTRLQADLVSYNEKTSEAVATGNVIYDPALGQRITASKATINIHNKTGTFTNTTGYTDQTNDGTLLQFVAEKIDKTGKDSYILYEASVTSCCEDTIPLWEISSSKTNVQVNHRVTARNGSFRILGKKILYLPWISIPLDKRNRQSGFLIPSTGSSTNTGRFFRNNYYQTLGDSADILIKGDIYTERGIGLGATFRARTSDNSYIKIGSYSVIDRILGKSDQDAPNQGGTLFFAQGIQHLPHGFLAVIDTNFTTSLDFRSIFASNIEDAFNPEKRSQGYLNNNFKNFSFNTLIENRITRLNTSLTDGNIEQTDVTIRQLPSLNFTAFPIQLWNRPIYISGEANLSALNRQDITNSFSSSKTVQRLDISPSITLPLITLKGLGITPSIAIRSTYYSRGLPSIDKNNESLFRRYVDFSIDVRPPALGKVFFKNDGQPSFKHIIEPYITYRRIAGIDNFSRTPRFDVLDTFTNTNELEYSIVNRFLVPKRFRDKKNKKDKEEQTRTEKNTKSIKQEQAQELLTISLTQKYFFDPTFGKALVEGNRNQIAPIMTLSGFNYGGQTRHLSPLNVNVRVYPTASMFTDLHLDYDTNQTAVRGFGITTGINQNLFKIQQRWYYSNDLKLPNNNPEIGTFAGNQLISSIGIGNESNGTYGGFNISYDFSKSVNKNSNQLERNGLIRSGAYLGYAFKCASIEANYNSINIGIATAGRLTFSFTLKGIGTFGTDQFAGVRDR